jgi:hypothetical protein
MASLGGSDEVDKWSSGVPALTMLQQVRRSGSSEMNVFIALKFMYEQKDQKVKEIGKVE